MSYQFLLFDLDHTLLDFEAGEDLALDQLLADYDFSDIAAFKAYYKPLNQQLWKALEQGKITKTELVNTRFSKAFAHFGRDLDGAELALTFQRHMGRQGQTFPGAAQLLADLKVAGYQLFGATNGITAIQQGRLAQSDIQPYFQNIFISEQLGTQKPEPAFFEALARHIPNFDKGLALMIGDSLTADILGGNQAGIDTAWYNPSQASNPGTAQPTHILHHYDDLRALLL